MSITRDMTACSPSLSNGHRARGDDSANPIALCAEPNLPSKHERRRANVGSAYVQQWPFHGSPRIALPDLRRKASHAVDESDE